WQSIEAWLFAVFVVMAYFAHFQRYTYHEVSRSHPNPLTRFVSFAHHLLFNVLAIGAKLMKQDGIDRPSDPSVAAVVEALFAMQLLKSLGKSVIERGEAAWIHLGVTSQSDERLGTFDAAIAEAEGLRKLLEARWNDLLKWRESVG